MLNVHSWIRQSLAAKSLDWDAIESDGHRSLVGAPAPNRFAVHNRRDILDAPLQVFELLRVALLEVFAGFLNHGFKEPQTGDTKVKKF